MNTASASPVPDAALTPIQQREREFYNQYSQTRKIEPACFDPIAGKERRPWNPYWEMFRIAQERFRPGMRLLDFGCGWGVFTVVYAKIGYHVDGFDISEGNVQAAREIAARYGMQSQVTIVQQTAEELCYPDESFDVVAGMDILHHVDIPRAVAECRRVLKPGGVALFREPLRNVVFDTARNSWLVRRLLSNDASLDRHITHDEEKIRPEDLAAIREIFPDVSLHRFHVLARFAALWKSAEMTLEKIDYRLRFLPGYQSFAGSGILELRKT